MNGFVGEINYQELAYDSKETVKGLQQENQKLGRQVAFLTGVFRLMAANGIARSYTDLAFEGLVKIIAEEEDVIDGCS